MRIGEAATARMKSATGTTALILGVYAGLLGMVHGLLEIEQGPVAPDGLLLHAVGAPCRPEGVARLPAGADRHP